VHLDDAIRFHLNAEKYARAYDPHKAGVPNDLAFRVGPIEPVLERLDPRLQSSIRLTDGEFNDLVSFIKDGLLDDRIMQRISVNWSLVVFPVVFLFLNLKTAFDAEYYHAPSSRLYFWL
jgi:hypothetical protein